MRLVDGQNSVHEIIAMSRLGEFEACQSLVVLLDQGFIEASRTKPKKNKKKEDRGLSIDLYQDYGVSSHHWFDFIPKTIYFLGTLFLVLGVLSYFNMGPLKFLQETGRKKIERPILHELISDYQIRKVNMALEVFFLEKGYYPKSLKALISSGLLEAEDLRYPWKKPYDYTSTGSEYRLEKPFI